MSTVADLIDRIYRDYLLPPDEQPTRFTVATGGINATSTTLPVNTALLDPVELELVGPGTLIEVVSSSTGGELMLVEAVVGDPVTSLTVRREMFGTTAASHAAGDYIYLAPDFPRQSVFDAVADTIETLWPRLWTVEVEETWIEDGPAELPAECEEILEVRALVGSRWPLIGGWELLSNFPEFDTNKAIQFVGGGAGTDIKVVYRAAATRPTAESDTFAELNIEEGWAKAIAVGAVAQVVADEDIDRATIDFIINSLEVEGLRVGEGADLRNSLLQFYDYMVGQLHAGLEARNPTQAVLYEIL